MLRIIRKRLHPIAQHCPVHTQIARGLRDTSPTLLDQLHRLEPEFSRKLPSLHDPPPVPAKHLTRCLRNRQQAMDHTLVLSSTSRPNAARTNSRPPSPRKFKQVG